MTLDRLNGDHLLELSCTYQAPPTKTQSATTGDVVESLGATTSLLCLINNPSRRWQATWPLTELSNMMEFWLPSECGAVVDGVITYNSVAYRISEIQRWPDMCLAALAKRVEST